MGEHPCGNKYCVVSCFPNEKLCYFPYTLKVKVNKFMTKNLSDCHKLTKIISGKNQYIIPHFSCYQNE